jgi:allantoicase
MTEFLPNSTPNFTQLADLAAPRLGGRVLAANDDFFAPKENLLKESKPVFIEGKYTARGKWMDGWETRRRRTPGYDWCIVRLGLPGVIRGIVVDTSFFTGNYPEQFSLEACDLGSFPYAYESKRLKDSATPWTELLPQTPLKGDSQNFLVVASDTRFTHLRLKIYPDGGVARLRVHGEAVPDAKKISRPEIDLVAVENGSGVVTSSDQFYGAPQNLLMPYRAKNMGDGWETKRRRGPGHDWVILKLGVPGTIQRIEVDTAHFKGNYPDRCSLEACHVALKPGEDFLAKHPVWKSVLPETKLKPNFRHLLGKVNDVGAVTHVRFHIYPDGGVSRLRLFGRPLAAATAAHRAEGVEPLNRASPSEARAMLLDCCGSQAWVVHMLSRVPFPNTASVLDTADQVWAALSHDDWLEAFRHHPAIGSKRGKQVQSTTARRWSKSEQSVAQQADAATLSELAKANEEYRAKFGHVFVICASGKTSEEILSNLRWRLPNNPEQELRVAAEEQRKITRLRLEKLLTS